MFDFKSVSVAEKNRSDSAWCGCYAIQMPLDGQPRVRHRQRDGFCTRLRQRASVKARSWAMTDRPARNAATTVTCSTIADSRIIVQKPTQIRGFPALDRLLTSLSSRRNLPSSVLSRRPLAAPADVGGRHITWLLERAASS